MQDTGIGLTEMEMLSQAMIGNQELHALTLSGNKLTDECAYELSKLIISCSRLTTLTLDKCELTS